LLLRDWDADQLGELREALAEVKLVERTALPPGVEIDHAREMLPSGAFTTWLQQVDASGVVRPRYEWAPGKDIEPPVPQHRFSAEWLDDSWVTGRPPEGLEGAGDLAPILERSLEGHPPAVEEIEALFRARGDQVDAVAHVADELRRQRVGDVVTYVVNRNINYTNLCYFRCGFCAFSKGPRSLNLRGDPYLMGLDEIVERAREAWTKGATEVTLQGGIHPDFTGNFYVDVVKAIKEELPEIHIHGFTPLEVWQGAETLGVTVRRFLEELKEAGLGTLPGTAAEVLDDEIRSYLCPDKIRTAQWAEVMLTAHDLGLRSTSTIMFGQIDHPRSWANHLEVIRQIQRRTGGITEMVPLPFVHMGAPIYLRGRSRPGPTWDEVVLIHAVSRIAFYGLIDNIQASWVKLGLEGGGRLLDAGCNDMGGTLMGEIITRSAGATHGQEVTPSEFRSLIESVGRSPAERSTTYEILDRVR
ncbi:MAG TPA: 7,8-didemethyl-8-hydroxy-5-deazariboflavin synthase subunit CofH, partial [Acidimicrobiia bacterium]|nr:7,8-didemethyl-8-hydroxy-5-deazariboflavin synthase subunit CofH [Acidimicrobiia bacterium]